MHVMASTESISAEHSWPSKTRKALLQHTQDAAKTQQTRLQPTMQGLATHVFSPLRVESLSVHLTGHDIAITQDLPTHKVMRHLQSDVEHRICWADWSAKCAPKHT